MKSLYFTTPTRPVGEKPPSKSMRQEASNPYVSFAPFPAPLPLFWHFSARPKLLVLGEALTQNFKKILHYLFWETKYILHALLNVEKIPTSK